MSHNGGRDQDHEIVLLDLTVLRGVLAFEVGVDRHLIHASSTVFWNPVDRHGAALLADQFPGFISHLDLHEPKLTAKANAKEDGGLLGQHLVFSFADFMCTFKAFELVA